MSASSAPKRFGGEILSFLNKRISAETSDGRIYRGSLAAIDEELNLILDDLEDLDGVSRMILNGSFVKELRLLERPVDLHALAEKLERVFPGLVKMRDDLATIIVMDKIRVTEGGVAEGTGLAAERVKAIYNEFLRESGKS